MIQSRPCLMCDIVHGRERSWIVAEDDHHLACLTPFPNTTGFTVVLTKDHHTSDLFAVDDGVYHAVLEFARQVARAIDRALGTRRTALMAEGMAIDHLHVKLMPLHGIPDGPWQPVHAADQVYFERYEGYISSQDGRRAPDHDLDEVASAIRRAYSAK